MCKLCEGKLNYANINNGWLILKDEQLPEALITFPASYCPWCGTKQKNDRFMPKVTPREWKHQMQEQEAENYDSSEDLC